MIHRLSQRTVREWPLFLLSAALVAAVCLPLRQWLFSFPAGTTQERLGRLLLGWEQLACYGCFVWGSLILLGRYLEVRRQYRAFHLGLLSEEEGARILPEDAHLLQRKAEQIAARGGPYILANLIRLALGKFAVTRSTQDVSETIRAQADSDLGRLVSSMATVHYLAWAIPAIGFLGTVRGLAMGIAGAGSGSIDLDRAAEHLNLAFDCTLVALALSLPIMFMIHSVQRDEEAMVIDCQQYCMEHLVSRLYDLSSSTEPVAHVEVATPLAARSLEH
jgi:biopolymer transport protein ExbB/TolQ